ncbi:MAG: alpha-amylase family protein [Candidatus Omnitrophota bacterium]
MTTKKKIMPYDQTAFRISENYLMPDQKVGGISRKEFENTLARCGVDARWIGVYDHGGPRFKSKYIPISKRVPGDLTVKLKKWVDIVHEAGMNAITWCSPAHCEAGWAEHPEWRFVCIDGTYHDKFSCCINTSYGDALIGMVLEFFEKFGLDGIWFDGADFASRSPVRQIPGCICPDCQNKFREETGYEIPTAVKFKDSTFRTWVKWRFKMYAAYLKKLVDTIHAHYPGKVITINHYHRYEPLSWHTACPLDLFECDIVTGSEAGGRLDLAFFSSKLAAAYGRKFDVWTAAFRWGVGTNWLFHEPNALMHHAAACITFGGYPAFGFENNVPEGSIPAIAESFLKPAAEFLRKRVPYIEHESANPVALHISQQTETFFFGRGCCETPGFGWYWNSALGWDTMLNEAGLGTDLIFDKHLNLERLNRYKVVVLPLSLGLSAEQGDVLKKYVSNGGVLVLGPWSGRLDTEGEPLPGGGVLAELRSVEEDDVPEPDKFKLIEMYLKNVGLGLPDLHGFGVYAMGAEQRAKKGAQTLMSREKATKDSEVSYDMGIYEQKLPKINLTELSAVVKHRYEKGYIVDLGLDFGASFYYAPSSPMRRFFLFLLEDVTDFPILVRAPACVFMALRREKDGNYLIHLNNFATTIHHSGACYVPAPAFWSQPLYSPITPRDIIPICGLKIEIRGLKVTKAERLVELPKPLTVEKEGELSVIRLERLELHEIIRISLEE